MKTRVYSKIPLAQSIVNLCELKGINTIVISPGSRSAPLTIGFTAHPEMNCYSIVDERCAAFFALGVAQQLRLPVALVCSSGSALLNYYPAITEAYYSDIPLVVLSADRPSERIDIGDGQTIRQENVFSNHILDSANLISHPDTLDDVNKLSVIQKDNELKINKALNIAISENGPVHINIPFYEPLYDKLTKPTVVSKNITVNPKVFDLPNQSLLEMQKIWTSSKRKMILIGVHTPKAIEEKWLAYFAADPSVLVFTETTSNIHHGSHVNSIDQLISSLDDKMFNALQPEVLVTIGGMVVSKRIKSFLRKYKPQLHWHIDEKKAYDTYFCLSEHIEMNPNKFFSLFFDGLVKIESDYKETWLKVRDARREKHKQYLDNIPFTDLKAFESIFNSIPDGQMLQLSNSSTIRYAQLFTINPTFTVFCNRGTSGIDGSTSTAIGAALASSKPTTLITGDLSFLYDSNGLWNQYIPSNFKIIVINNAGGGIFRILPGKDDSANYETFFETKHELTAIHLSKMFGFGYTAAQNQKELLSGLKNIYNSEDKPQLLEVFTPRKLNDSTLIDYFRYFV